MLLDPGEFTRSLIGPFLVENNPSGCNQLLNVARKVFERCWLGVWVLAVVERGPMRTRECECECECERERERGRLRSAATRVDERKAFGRHSRTFQGHPPDPGKPAAPLPSLHGLCLRLYLVKISYRLEIFDRPSSIDVSSTTRSLLSFVCVFSRFHLPENRTIRTT